MSLIRRTFVAALLILPFAVIAADGPKANVLLPTFDFGTVNYGQKVQHEFLVRNDGNQPLRITDAASRCPCLKATFDPLIGPGQIGKIRVEMDTAALSDYQREIVTLSVNDPKSPKVNVLLQGRIRGPVVITPSEIVLKLIRGEQKSQEITIENNRKKPLKLVSVSSTKPAVSAKLTTVQQGQKYRVVASVDPSLAPGSVVGDLIIPSSDRAEPPMKIPYSVLVLSPIQVRPNVIYVGAKEGDDVTRKETVALRHLKGRKFEIKSAQANLPGATIQRGELEDGPGYELKVTMPLTGMAKGMHTYLLAITTDAPDAPTIEIPISVRIN